MFETLNEISNFHSRLRCKVDVIVEKSLIENVLEASKLNSDREILLSKIQELECFNFKNIANKKFKFGFVIENKKSIFSTHSPVFLGICNLVPTEETIKLLESGYNGYNQASINEKLSFQEEAFLNILTELFWRNSDELIKDLTDIEHNTHDFISIETFVGFKNESDLDFLSQLINISKLKQLVFGPKFCKTIPIDFFRKIENLAYLDIRNLKNLSESFNFTYLKNLISLECSYCKNITIKRENFIGLTKLNNLAIKESKNVQLENDTFNELVNLEYLSLQNNKLKNFDSIVIKELKNLKHFNLSENNLTKIDFGDNNNNELSYLNDKEFDELLNNDYSKRLLNCFHSNLEYLNIRKNKIKWVQINSLNYLINLKNLILSSNEISEMDTYAFNGLVNLEELDLSNNQLTRLKKNAFIGLKNLKKLFLLSNDLDFIEDGAFYNLVHLEELNLSKNKLIELKSCCFNELINLKNLILSINKISELENGAFNGLVNLEKLDLCSNKLEVLKNHWFNDLKNVKILNFSFNNISHIEDDVFYGMENLEHINLLSNSIEILNSNSFKHILNKQNELRIKLNNNPLCRVQIGDLSGITIKNPSTDIYLAKQVGSDIFEAQKYLECLNLNYRNCVNFRFSDSAAKFNLSDKDIFINFKELEFDYLKFLSYSNIGMITSNSKMNSEQFNSSDLVDYQDLNCLNNLICLIVDSVKDLEKLQLENLRYLIINQVDRFPKVSQNFKGLKALKLRDVSHLEEDCFENLQDLEYLHTDARNDSILDKIEANTFKGLNNLKYFKLSQMKNDITNSFDKINICLDDSLNRTFDKVVSEQGNFIEFKAEESGNYTITEMLKKENLEYILTEEYIRSYFIFDF